MALTVSVDEIVASSKNPLLAIRPGWKRVRLGEIASVLNGFAFKSSQFTKDGGMPLIRIRDVGNDSTDTNCAGDFDENYIVEPGELLIGMDGDFNCARWKGPRGLLNQRVCKVTLQSDEYHPHLFDYALPGYLKAINDATSSVTVKHLSSRTVEEIPLPFPSRAEQDVIVVELDKQFSRLDEAVASLKRIKANLKRYKAAVLKAAVEGKLTEDWRKQHPDVEPASKLLDRILAERRAHWMGKGKYKEPITPDTSNLHTLPKKWIWTSLGQLAEVGTGATPRRGKPRYYTAGHIPWVTSSALNKKYVDKADEFVTDAALLETNLTLYPPGTLLLAMYGEGKTRGKCSELRIHATTNQAIAAIQCPDKVRDYLKLAIWNQYEDLRRTASGGVQPNLNLSLVRSITISLPPIVEQRCIIAEVERRLSVIEELEAVADTNLTRADRLRQSILCEAFSGRLIGKNAQHSPDDIPSYSMAAEGHVKYGGRSEGRKAN